MTDTPTRWTMRECAHCKTLWPMGISLCQFCARSMNIVVTVVAAHAARASDPDTSKQAALKMEPKAASRRGRILSFLRANGPATAREIEGALEMPGAWKRVSELKQGGHIHEIGVIADRVTHAEVTLFSAGPAPARNALFDD